MKAHQGVPVGPDKQDFSLLEHTGQPLIFQNKPKPETKPVNS